MAGYQLNTSTDGSTDWSAWANANEKAWKGLIDITLNNWDTTDAPSIAKGGCVEGGGSIFYFGDTEAITGSPSTSNLNYIMLTVSSTNVAASYTTTAPSWVANKNGWYDATEAKRYIGGCGINLGMKWVYDKGRDNIFKKVLNIGDWDMDATISVTVAHGLGTGWKNIRMANVVIRRDDDARYEIFDGSLEFDGAEAVAQTVYIAADNITIYRDSDGFYDQVNYNSTGFNRGYVTVEYKV